MIIMSRIGLACSGSSVVAEKLFSVTPPASITRAHNVNCLSQDPL